jgi:hypothetical protein
VNRAIASSAVTIVHADVTRSADASRRGPGPTAGDSDADSQDDFPETPGHEGTS